MTIYFRGRALRRKEPAATTEAEQRRALRRNRTGATLLLLVVAAVFVATALDRQTTGWVALVRATAEAALVGGLADWFAVTAVFRRPLGLPIPHTAIVPAGKDRIGAGLARFLETHFLADELLATQLRNLGLARRTAAWLGQPANAEAVAGAIAAALPPLLAAADDQELRNLLRREIGDLLRRFDPAPLVARMIELAAASGVLGELLDRGLDHARGFIERSGDRLIDAAARPRGSWLRRAIDREVGKAMLRGLREVIEDARRPDGALRPKLLAGLVAFAAEIATSPRQRGRIAALKRRMLRNPEVEAWLDSLWDQGRAALLRDLGSPRSAGRDALALAVAGAAQAVLADPALAGRLDVTLEAAVAAIPWRAELVRFIAAVVGGWDATSFADRIELAVGRDLQYIRVNGTLVGGGVGLLLYLLLQAL